MKPSLVIILWFFSVIDVDLRVVGCMVVVMPQELGQWRFS